MFLIGYLLYYLLNCLKNRAHQKVFNCTLYFLSTYHSSAVNVLIIPIQINITEAASH